MFQTVDEMRAEHAAQTNLVDALEAPVTMVTAIEMLEAEISAGKAKSPRLRARTALVSLLGTKGATPATVELSLAWFDRMFPLDGWNPISMPKLTRDTYLDYRKRARAAIERTTGVAQKRLALRRQVDGWTDLDKSLRDMAAFAKVPAHLIPFNAALTRRARERNLQPTDLTNEILRELHDDGPNDDRKSLRNVARCISNLQNDFSTSEAIRLFFPHDIEPILIGPQKSLGLPDHFELEIEEMIEKSSRKYYVRIKKKWEYYKNGTRGSHRVILRRILASLIAVGELSVTANTFRSALENQDSLMEALGHIHYRAEGGEIKWSTARLTATRLPVILERNGINLPDLREMIGEVEEFQESPGSGEMSNETKEFCRALIERPSMLADFGTAHLPLRSKADRILETARAEGRELTQIERAHARQLGAVALFSAIETGGAPIRIENFLEMPISGPSPWLLRPSKTEFRISIPAGRTKNGKPIKVSIRPDEIECFESIKWFLERIRPLFFETASTTRHEAKAAAERCPFLLPAVQSDDKPLNYRSFADWFGRWMRDVAGIVCKPHNFRHGQASVLYFAYPERLDVISQRLGDKIETVVKSYAWVHSELKMREGQEMMVSLIRDSLRKTGQW